MKINCAIPALHAPCVKPSQLGSATLHCLRLIKECGFDGVQLNLSCIWPLLERCDRKIWSDLAVASIAVGSRVDAVHFLPLDEVDTHGGSKEKQSLLFCIAETLGARKIVVHPGGPLHWGPRCLQKDVRGVKTLARLAAKTKATVLVENTPAITAAYVGEVIRAVDRGNVKMQLDVGHYQIKNRASLESVLSEYSDILGGVELSDNDGVHDQHGVPATGVVPWKKVFSLLNRIQFQGPLTVESELDLTTDRCVERTGQLRKALEFVEAGFCAASSPVA